MDFFKRRRLYPKLSVAKHNADAEILRLDWSAKQRKHRKQLVESGVVNFIRGSNGYEVYVHYELVAILGYNTNVNKSIIKAVFYTVTAMRNAPEED